MKAKNSKQKALWMGKWLGLPLLIYFIFFCFYTWPWISQFSSHFWTDAGDGFQNVWNVWWIDKSIVDLGQHPWYTTFLHYPYGVSLLGQTLNPFNGFMALGLLRFMNLVQAFNSMVLFSFVGGGVTAFWLSYEFCKKYWAALIGGFIFTFSSYHFAHAIGHMQLVSLEFIPLFLLLWWRLLKKPRYLMALGAGAALLLVLLCDYYYFFYSIMAAVLMTLYLLWKKQLPFQKRQSWLAWALFVGFGLIFIAPLPLKLLLLNHKDKLLGGHPVADFSLNLPTAVVDGGFWRFGWLTNSVWSRIPGFISESSVYVGMVVIVLFIISWLKRRKLPPELLLWQGMVLIFGILSLGPRLTFLNKTVFSVPLPYVLLEKLFPTLKLSGVPVRMMVMVSLASAVIAAMVLAKLNLKKPRSKLLVGLAFTLLVIEFWPARLPSTLPSYPNYVSIIKNFPSTGIVDNAAPSATVALYNQTIHEHPMVLGYVSRTPTSVDAKDNEVIATISEGRYEALCSVYKVRYFSTPVFRPLNTSFPIIYKDADAIIYDLKNSDNC